MKIFRASVFFLTVLICVNNTQAQSSSSAEKAIVFADSFLTSFRNNDLEQYTNLSYPGVITYYGGNKNFREYVERARILSKTGVSDNITLVQIVNDVSELQCVIRKTSEATIDGKKARIVSYLIGQSKDDGACWKFVDVAQSSPGNLVYIMPDISGKLDVPQREIIFN